MIRVGFVGCGSHSGTRLYPALRRAGLQFVAVCDLDADRARSRATEYGLSAHYTDHRAMCASGDLQSARRFGALAAFGALRMANLLFTYELARRLEGSGVTANAVHPGLVRSGLMREAPFPVRLVTRLVSASPERAAGPIVRLATAPELAGRSGRLYRGGWEIASNTCSRDPAVQRRLWEESTRLVGLAA